MTIYIELLGEGTPCWRPVEAEELPDGSFRIIESIPEDEQWSFKPGDVVQCRRHQFQSGRGLVAYKKR
jgi:hypothetical protein